MALDVFDDTETAAQRRKRLKAQRDKRNGKGNGRNGVTDASFAEGYGDDFGDTTTEYDDEISEFDLGRDDDRPSEEWTANWEQEQADIAAQRDAELEQERLRKEREDQEARDRVEQERRDREEAERLGASYTPQDRGADPPLSEKDQLAEDARASSGLDQSGRASGSAETPEQRRIRLERLTELTDKEDLNPYRFRELSALIKSGDISNFNPQGLLGDTSLTEAEKQTLTKMYDDRIAADARAAASREESAEEYADQFADPEGREDDTPTDEWVANWEAEQERLRVKREADERNRQAAEDYASQYDNNVDQEGATEDEQASNEAVDRLRLDAGLEQKPDKPTQDSDGVPIYTLVSQGKVDGQEPVFWSEATQSWHINYIVTSNLGGESTTSLSKIGSDYYDRDADLAVVEELTEKIELDETTPEQLAERSFGSFELRFASSEEPNEYWPTQDEILADPHLSDEQKQNLIDRYYPAEDEQDEVDNAYDEYQRQVDEIDLIATARDRYGNLLNAAKDLIARGGDPATVNWNELRSAADEAGFGDLFNQQDITSRGEKAYYDSQRGSRQTKAYNDLVGKFMSGGTVDPHQLATADLTDDQRKDIQSRLNAYNDRQAKQEADRKAKEDRDRVAQETADREAEEERERDRQAQIEAEQAATQNPLIDTPEKAEASAQFREWSAMIYDSITSNDPSLRPSMYEIETSNFLSAAEKKQLREMFPKAEPTIEEQADAEREANADTKESEDYFATSAGKEIIEVSDLRDLIIDVMDNLVGTASEEQILELVKSRLGSQNLFADSATLLNTIARVNDFYYEQFAGTRTRPLTFIEREEQLIKDREDTVVTVDEVDTTTAKFALFDKWYVSDEFHSKPEEAYRIALDNGAPPTEAYKVFKEAGGVGSPPQGKRKSETVTTTNEDGSEDVRIFEFTDESFGHGFSADDVFKMRARSGETEDEFWERAKDAEWLAEIKDVDTGLSYTTLSPAESDAIVDKMMATMGKNLEDSPELANVLAGLERYKNADDGEKNALQEDFTDALSDALTAFGDSDLDEEKRLLRASAKADYEDQLEEANRYFLVNGLSGSGQEQRGFEDLSSEYLKGLRQIDLAISEKKSAYIVTQIQTLTEALSSVANIGLSEDKLDLTAEELEERGRQFDATLKQNKEETEATLEIRNRELGIEQNKFYETIRQFNKSLTNEINQFSAQWGLSEMETVATIRKINSDIANQTRSLSNEISQTWAQITGVAGDMEGEISLSDLGVPADELTDELRELPAGYLAQTDVGKTIADSWSAMTGQNITLEQLKSIVDGETLAVSGMPTLESRQIATAITMQNLDRMNKYSVIAKENEFEVTKFEAAKDQADRSWYLTIGDVSKSFGLENDAFRDAKYQYDKMFDPLSADPSKNGEENPDLIYMAEEKAREIYLSSAGVVPGDERYDEVNAAFLDKWGQANEVFDNTHGNQLKDIAQANRFEEDKFIRANEQADAQEEKYEEVWGALMGARDKDPTAINLYQSNRRLWNDALEHVSRFSDAGTSLTGDAYDGYVEAAKHEPAEGMDAFMAGYDHSTATKKEKRALLDKWRTFSPESPSPINAANAIKKYNQMLEARKILQQIDDGEVTVLNTENTMAMVASLMDNPPPGLFENINNTYGILNDQGKREVLTGIVQASIQDREMDKYRDPETGEAIMTYNDLGLEWLNEDGSWVDDDNWFDDGRGWLSRGIRAGVATVVAGPQAGLAVGLYDTHANASAEEKMLDKFYKRSGPGGELEGVTLVDLLQNDEYEDYINDSGEFKMKQEGKAKLMEFNGNFNATFGRNPTVREAMTFRATGSLNLESDDPSIGYVTSMNVRLVPENWIDNYNEPGQLEGIFALLNGGNVTPERNVGRTSGWSKFGNIAGGIVGAAAGAFAGGAGQGLAAGMFPTPNPNTAQTS